MEGKSSTSFPGVMEDWDELNKNFSELEGLQKSYLKSADQLSVLERNCKKSFDNHSSQMARMLQSLKCFGPLDEREKEEMLKLKMRIASRKQELKEMQSTLPKDNGLYLKIVLGDVDVTLLDANAKYKYKDEYEKFKLVVTVLVLALSTLSILFPYRAFDAVLHFLLVWYYCTLTIRESILKVNGSRIKGWWRAHHFITTGLTGVLIVWPDGSTYQSFRMQFLLYCCYSSFLQFLQSRYQQGCLYRLRALGERYNMDITVDGFHSWMWKGLRFLLPFLSIGYAWQLYNAYVLSQLCLAQACEWQVYAVSAIFLVLFSGNTATTAVIVHQKLNLRGRLLKKST